jgi:hypothetical protein
LSFFGGALSIVCAPQWLGSAGESILWFKHPNPKRIYVSGVANSFA